MENKLLECGHTQPVKNGSCATWCPICNEMALVRDAPQSDRLAVPSRANGQF
jgi:hypothetical protein